MWIIIREANNSKRGSVLSKGPRTRNCLWNLRAVSVSVSATLFVHVSRRSSIVRCGRVAKVACFVLVARDELRRVRGAGVNGGCTVILRVGPPRCFMYNEQDRVCWGSHSRRVGKRLEALLLPTHVSYHFASHRLPANKFSQ